MPNDGIFSAKGMTNEQAVALFKMMADNGSGGMENYSSAIGHESTASALNVIFGLHGSEKIRVNRQQIKMKAGDEALCFKVNGRLPEGTVLSLEEISAVGFEFIHVWMIANSHDELEDDAISCGAAPITGSIWRPSSKKVWSNQLNQYI